MPVSQLISCIQRARERRQTCFFFIKFNPSHTLQEHMNEQHSFCSVMCYVLHCTNINIDFIDFKKITYCNNHLIYLNQCTTFRIPTYKINASIRICIRQMRILTSFVTSILTFRSVHTIRHNTIFV